MKRFFVCLSFLLTLLVCGVFMVNAQSVNSSVRYQKGYVKKDGTYVQGHYKTHSNKTNHDNFSTQTNRNPYTWKKGEKAKDYSKEAYRYGQGRRIQTGPKGGQYYVNDKGRKVYVPKRKKSL